MLHGLTNSFNFQPSDTDLTTLIHASRLKQKYILHAVSSSTTERSKISTRAHTEANEIFEM